LHKSGETKVSNLAEASRAAIVDILKKEQAKRDRLQM
jgi:hypothetical protein